VDWLHAKEPTNVFVTAITQAELLYGIERLPEGKRRDQLAAIVEEILAKFVGRVLSYDETSSRIYPKIVVTRQSLGRPIAFGDAMIAAIVRANDATLATRDVGDFEHCGIPLINPWEQAADVGK
jgi:predicted nucleic acid-binding protein